ncbi:hypothetical protein B0J17DRAFT_683060 [Rhizoctonia solani]|nr:hypothetical protein B0J17DRAFT_683060 [Rhizoctonia solani]
MVQLELANLNFSVVDNISGYALLQRALSRFLRLVAANSALFMEHPHGNLVVSFSRTLSAPRYEIQRFVMYDTAAALVFGISPLVEYGYDGECDPESHKLEWVHGIPVVFLEAISQVNSWRAGSRVHLDNWQTLEKRVLAWQSPHPVPDETSGIMSPSVARATVQEGWRHVVLIYIYMGICGVSSHDPRVQASVHQIVRFGEMVADLPICVQMFAHCIVAGLGARLERHRIFVHKMLLSFKNTRIWLFQGPPFSKVLYHLWHGVGAGGAPVTWDDYVQTRRVLVPI